MKKILFSILVLITTNLYSQCDSSGLILDHGFEEMGLLGIVWENDCYNDSLQPIGCAWDNFQDGGHIFFTSLSYDGDYCFDCSGGGISQTIELLPNANYELGCWVRNLNLNFPDDFYLSMGAESLVTSIPPNSGWQYVTLPYSTGATQLTTVISFYGLNMYVDNFDLCSDSELGIDNNSLSNSMSLYPNPSNGRVNLDLRDFNGVDGVKIRVFSNKGELLLELENITKTEHQFYLNQSPGLYVVEVSSTQGVSYLKLIKN